MDREIIVAFSAPAAILGAWEMPKDTSVLQYDLPKEE